ncbi:BLUF domain-containing protein [Bradyrhizobium jicamae]|uniref:BLUF domain-containing protein n=1 Tax=Bradyrhizobium jicamae TaxID=280332 RepID=UPI001BA8278E|nr:BLUF domain-containing protein [Bradyrhizobium jicamae]MBR0932459.1 BLUF domain-containing protein [Bradyrhizobium jicamae]
MRAKEDILPAAKSASNYNLQISGMPVRRPLRGATIIVVLEHLEPAPDIACGLPRCVSSTGLTRDPQPLFRKACKMPQDLHSLIYVSHSNSHVSHDAADRIINDILLTSRTRNARLGVTGALLFSEGCFTQVLEGDKNAVETIYDAIQRDMRHRDVTLLSFKPARVRYFSEWSMAYAGISVGPVWTSKIEGLLVNPSAIDGGELGCDLIEMMTDLVWHQELDRPAFRGPG